MSVAFPANLTQKSFPTGAGELLAATARGTFKVVVWVAPRADLTALVRKLDAGDGEIISVEPIPGTTASLAWSAGTLNVATSAPVARFATVIKL